MLEKLKSINEKLISLYKNDEELLAKQLLIQKILLEDKCFFKMDIKTATSILKDLNIKDNNIHIIYKKLIVSKNF